MINTHMFEIARRFSGISDSCHHSHFSATCVTDRDVYLEDSGEHLGPGIVFQGIFLGTAFFVGDAFFVIWFQDDHFAVLGVWREDATPFDEMGFWWRDYNAELFDEFAGSKQQMGRAIVERTPKFEFDVSGVDDLDALI